ncbi:G/U mismatch-specific DNA glycosylase [Paenibacillus sp. J2TS4]|uniref:G/U mismatch-specific DNA glycosylase n=1 Tax=Paenibacillus sp. J2TS4 TaxID=2807194 RepID=UPI001B2E3B62|nr:G/U mismatch-specific DNA glycosylase [Paenibacillus sp. J2TS4]GIP33156.1 G/U mismatch-specific DNA glycosylase [Paenibacillus sp. J2TS4]
MSRAIPDHLRTGLKLLFVGYNPSLKSGETGHHYANPNNRFWRVLYEAGLTPRKYSPEEDGELLALGYGFTNIVDRPTRTAAEINKEEYEAGRKKLRAKIEDLRPQVVCFVGKGVYQQYSKKRTVSWGIQEESTVPGVIDFVAPSTSGLVRMSLEDMTAIFRQLKSIWATPEETGSNEQRNERRKEDEE